MSKIEMYDDEENVEKKSRGTDPSILAFVESIPYTVKEYETKIENSLFFSIDKCDSPVQYEAEYLKLVENLTYYLYKFSPRNVQYTEEIFDVILNCLKYYDKKKGNFLHYFNYSWSKKEKSLFEDVIDTQFNGVALKDSDKEHIYDFEKYLAERSEIFHTLTYDQKIKDIAAFFDCGTNRAIKILTSKNYQVSISQAYDDEDGNTQLKIENIGCDDSTFEFIFDDNGLRKNNLIDKVCEVFLSKDEEQQCVLSMLLTAKCCKTIDLSDEKSNDLICSLKQLPFYNEQILSLFIKTGKAPQSKEIAKILNRKPESISRTLSIFMESIT